MKKSSTLPFSFVLDELDRLNPVVRPMFGCHAVYVAEKIVLILRNKPEHPADNGVWIATKKEHHVTLKVILPSMRTIFLLGNGGETNWQNLPVESNDFEECVQKACALVLKSDNRIGNIPKPRKSKTKKLL